MAPFRQIAVDPTICGGRPIVAGTRLRVSDVLEMLGAGAKPEEIVADYPYIDASAISDCLAYAALLLDHPVVLAAE